MRKKRMKPVIGWKLVSESGNTWCGAFVYATRDEAKDKLAAFGLKSWRVAKVRISEITK